MRSTSTTPTRSEHSAGCPETFWRSLLPMLALDDTRRYRAANHAACLLFRRSQRGVLTLRVDDVTPPENLPALHLLWGEFLANGTQTGVCELLMPDGQRLHAAYTATANACNGLHVTVLDPQPGSTGEVHQHGGAEADLSGREREVLALVALGETGATIARDLHISIATVETHIRHCLAKLGARNRTHAVLLALKRGDISLG
jgi:two-component system NarL family response regulator